MLCHKLVLSMPPIVDVIAPSGRFPIEDLAKIHTYLENQGYIARIPEDILGPDLLSANSDALRFEQLKQALLAEDSQLIWCVRGGYGATRLIPELEKLTPPPFKKTLIGFSDITALHLFLSQKWDWQTMHGASLRQMAEPDLNEYSRSLTEAVLFQGQTSLQYTLNPLNQAAKNLTQPLQAKLSGGNLKLVEASLGTRWQIDAEPKILVLEEVSEYDFRVDRSLTHLAQAGIFETCQAVVLGDFTHEHAGHQAKLEPVLQRFANAMAVPVFRLPGMGHGKENLPWFYAPAKISDGALLQTFCLI